MGIDPETDVRTRPDYTRILDVFGNRIARDIVNTGPKSLETKLDSGAISKQT